LRKDDERDDILRCSFCSKSQNDVKKLIAGPTVYICDECVDVCNEIIADDVVTSPIGEKLPKPQEIKEFLDLYVIGRWRFTTTTSGWKSARNGRISNCRRATSS